MATATEISTRALRRLKVYDALQSPSAADVSAATEALTALIASWEAEGLSDDTLPLDGRFEQAVVAMLAVRLAEEYGKEPGSVLLRDAKNGWDALQATFMFVPKSRFDVTLQEGASSNQFESVIDLTVSNYQPWAAGQAYALRTKAYNGAKLYEVTTAGTSASSGGPTGTGSSITDGTVVWCFRQISAS